MADARIENEYFFSIKSATFATRAMHVPSDVFFTRAAPPRDVGPVVRAARTPLRFALSAFLIGWAGILFQASLLQQVVFGAPVFEELAKLGPALLVATALRMRAVWLLVPLGWLSGAAFGVFEHVSTYPDEDLASYATRVLFHGGSTGLSMAFWGAFVSVADVRARWATTASSTLLHWANNFMAVVFGFASLALPFLETVASVLSVAIGVTCVTGALFAMLAPRGFVEVAQRAVMAAIPRLGL